jgi:hypothetical protein
MVSTDRAGDLPPNSFETSLSERHLRPSLLRISLDLAILAWYIRDGKTYLNDRYFDQMPALPMQSLRT